MCAEASLPLKLAPNFRSLGGLCTAAGRMLREGVLFRSGAFDNLDEADARRLEVYGIRTVFDLRRAGERKRQPNRFSRSHAPRVVSFDLAASLGREVEGRYWESIRRQPNACGARWAMCDVYRHMPATLHGWIATLFETLASADATPAVIHCAVGKDRTGVVCALLLHALGMAQETIMADYLASDGRYPESRKPLYAARIESVLSGGDVSQLDAIRDALTGVRREYLEAAFAAMERGWGSIDGFIASAGVGKDRILEVRELLLT